jgi:hypothetical protein
MSWASSGFSALLLIAASSTAFYSELSVFMFTECTLISTLGLSLSRTVLHSLNSLGRGAPTHKGKKLATVSRQNTETEDRIAGT